MEQSTSYTSKKLNNKGFAALTIVLLAAVLASISFIVIQYGRISLNVMYEKQLLDTCSINVGSSINYTNDINTICSSDNLNQCGSIHDSPEPDFSCEDLGLTCNADNRCKRRFKITSTYDPGRGYVSKENVVEINEEVHDIELINTAVILLLDFSGSMRGNRMRQLKTTVRQFVNADYNLSYSVILYNDRVIIENSIGKASSISKVFYLF